jgi:hypothetical protein
MSEKDYTVGYGWPPVQTRFQKGTSGNPKGRPRKSKNTATIMKALLDEEVIVTKSGEQLQMTAHEAMLNRQRNKALAGDIKALKLFLPGIGDVESAVTEQQREDEARRQEELRIVRAMTTGERKQYLAIVQAARKRADEASAAKRRSEADTTEGQGTNSLR